MNAWGYTINQWNIGQRLGLLFMLLLMIGVSGYIFLYAPWLEKNKAVISQQATLQTMLQELALLKTSSENFIYQNDIQSVQVRQVMQQAASQIPGLTINNFVSAPPITLPSMAQQLVLMQELFTISWQKKIQQSSVSIVFSGDFDSFLQYLKILSHNQAALYFDGIDFTMKRYPIAEITMKVFTLGV